ncbi:MAG: ABC transporter ATP-binding protein [Verrucomicrobia bacterium]|nr:ABC transporter ATP-binding protein [Verrucomicrobiota bacterium]
MPTIFRVFRYLRRYPCLGAGNLGFAILATITVVVFPSVTQRIIDDAVRGNHPELILPLALVALGAFALQNLANGLRILLNNTFEQRVIFDLRSDLYNHIQRLPLSWFDQQATGDIMTRVLEDVNAVERVLIDGIEQGSVALLQIIIVTGMLIATEPWLGLLALTPVPFLVAGALWYTLTAKSRYAGQRKAASAMNALLHDNLAGVRQIKAYAREDAEHGRFNRAGTKLKEATLVVMKAWAIYDPSMEFFAGCGLVIVTAFGGNAVLHGQMGLGELVGSLILVRFLYEPISRLHSLNQMLQSSRAAADRLYEILDQPREDLSRIVRLSRTTEEASGRDQDFSPLGFVEYRNVSFGYEPGRLALRNISLSASPGQMIALVGHTGAGKSTLVSLLLRFYELGPEGGEILVDHCSIQQFSKATLRRIVGFVTQETFLFNGSIRENLLFGNPEASEEELEEALTAAFAIGFVRKLPEGLDSKVGERGVKLSVGEKQRLSIARALLKDPPILVLDEATASVDTETEREIQSALHRLLLGRTSFVIAHRLSTIRQADQILVLDEGEIVERGTHDELLLANGVYRRLYQSGLFAGESAEVEDVIGDR